MPELRKVTVRCTRQARAVAAVLPTLPGFRSAREIHAALRGQVPAAPDGRVRRIA